VSIFVVATLAVIFFVLWRVRNQRTAPPRPRAIVSGGADGGAVAGSLASTDVLGDEGEVPYARAPEDDLREDNAL